MLVTCPIVLSTKFFPDCAQIGCTDITLSGMCMVLKLPTDVCRLIVVEWLDVFDIGRLDVSFGLEQQRKYFHGILRDHPGLSLIQWQSAKSSSVYEWIFNRGIKLTGLKFSEALVNSEGSISVPVNVDYIERVSIRYASRNIDVNINNFLATCKRMTHLRMTGVNNVDILPCGVLSQLRNLALFSCNVETSEFLKNICDHCTKLSRLDLEFNCIGHEHQLECILSNNPKLEVVSFQCRQSVLNNVHELCPLITSISISTPNSISIELFPICQLFENRPVIQQLYVRSKYNTFSYLVDEKNPELKTLKLLQYGISFEEPALRQLFRTVGAITSFSLHAAFEDVSHQPSVLQWMSVHGHALTALSLVSISIDMTENILLSCPCVEKLFVNGRYNMHHILIPVMPRLMQVSCLGNDLSGGQMFQLIQAGTRLDSGTFEVQVSPEEDLTEWLQAMSGLANHVALLELNIRTKAKPARSSRYTFTFGHRSDSTL